MAQYVVVEEIHYLVDADDDEAAVQHVIDDPDRDQHCFVQVVERYAYSAD